jgi:hypothetical protein
MKLNLNEIVELHYELNGMTYTKEGVSTVVSNGLLKQKTSMKNKLYFQRLNKVVEAEVKLLDESKKELFDKFGEGDGEERFIPKEKMEEFNKEYVDLLNAEKEIDVVSLWSTDITPDTLESIETEEVYPVFLKLVDK